MKAIIKKYPLWVTSEIHSRWIDWRYGGKNVNWDNLDILDSVMEGLEGFLQTLYNNTINLRSQKQKVSVRIDPWDTWSMDCTLSYIILPMLLQLKENKHGAPIVDNEDVPEELRVSEEDLREYNHNGDVDPLFHKRWDYVLDEMIFTFKALTTDEQWEEQFYSYTEFPKEMTTCKAMGLPGELVVDREGLDSYNARINNGCRLFGKYLRTLWS